MTASLATRDPVLIDFAEEVGADDPVAIEGGRTRWTVGGPPAEGTRVLLAPDGIVDYAPEEMTVKVRTGTSVAELHAHLAERGQGTCLPERGGTVGGALAVGENDIGSLGRGLVRASVLQVRYVSAEGRIVTSGGPTVKNVSGFDLPRLMVGSLGTLGLLAEVVLRTNPLPPATRWLLSRNADPQQVFDTVLAPGTLLWDGTRTWIELIGHPADVDAEHERLATVGTFSACDGPPELPPHRWSISPRELLHLDGSATGGFIGCVGFGLTFAARPQPQRRIDPSVTTVSERLKAIFDPTGRLNPGRVPGRS